MKASEARQGMAAGCEYRADAVHNAAGQQVT